MNYFDNFPKKAKEAVGIPGFKMNQPVSGRAAKKGDVGIEFEFEAVNSLPWDSGQINQTPPCKTTGAYWQAKEDNSLRGGVEYVTTAPVDIESVPEMVRGLYKSLADFKTKLRLSNRCSTHVHLNATTWKVDRLVSFYLLWAVFEPLLIEWCGPRRKVNHFCLSITDSPSTALALTGFLKKGEWRLAEGDKYSALNIRRLFDIGTVEVRCGDAWDDPERAIRWIKFLHAMAAYSEGLNPAEIPARLSGDTVFGILAELCNLAETPEMYEEIFALGSEEELTRKAMTSFREVMHLAYQPAWDQWLPLINREYIRNPFGESTKKIKINPRLLRPDGARIDDWAQVFVNEVPPAPQVR